MYAEYSAKVSTEFPGLYAQYKDEVVKEKKKKEKAKESKTAYEQPEGSLPATTRVTVKMSLESLCGTMPELKTSLLQLQDM